MIPLGEENAHTRIGDPAIIGLDGTLVVRKAVHMITERFSRLFSRLLTRWVRYQDAPRDPAQVAELAAARNELDEIRTEIATERSRVSSAPRVTKDFSRVAVSDADLRRLRVSAIGVDSTS